MTDTSKQEQDRYVPVGYVRKAHGIRGDVLVRGLVADAADRFEPGSPLVTGQEVPQPFVVTSSKPHAGDYILHLEGLDTRNDAEILVGIQFVIDVTDRRSLSEDEWWFEDLVGCELVDVHGAPVGIVTEVIEGAAQERLAVETPNGATGEVPFVAAMIRSVDLDKSRIVVDLPDGLFE